MPSHYCVNTNNNQIFHTIRRDDGSWGKWGDVFTQSPDPSGGQVSDLAGALTSDGIFHLCMVAGDGRIWHTLRDPTTGQWQKTWGDPMTAGAGQPPNQSNNPLALPSQVRCGAVGTDLHLIIHVPFIIIYTIRDGVTGAWQPWGNVLGQAGGAPTPGFLNTIVGIVAAGL